MRVVSNPHLHGGKLPLSETPCLTFGPSGACIRCSTPRSRIMNRTRPHTQPFSLSSSFVHCLSVDHLTIAQTQGVGRSHELSYKPKRLQQGRNQKPQEDIAIRLLLGKKSTKRGARTCHEQHSCPEKVRQPPKHEIAVRGVERVRVYEVVETLRRQAHRDPLVQHAWAHLVENFWLHL
jgi:hypothetical protein